jgi:hypothetical protein
MFLASIYSFNGNRSASFQNGDECGLVKWSYGSGSVSWKHDDECSSTNDN